MSDIILGSSLTFSAHGWWGKEKNIVVAKNSVRPSEGMAEGGCGGNSALPSQKIEASPATLLSEAGHHRKILFSLREKEIRRVQNEKSKEYFSVVWRAERAVAGLASLVPFKVGSPKVQNIPHNNTSAFFREDCLGASPLGLVALRKAQSHIIPRRRKRKGSGLYI